jgi:glycosyltransferase involved in cell wall biosynthesis
MKVSGFSFVRNAVKFDYPFLESIQSLLPLCDEFIIAVGKSDDNTLDRIKGLDSPKIKIIKTVWDESLRVGGAILAQQTNVALDGVSGDWAFYLQGDEILHEDDLQAARASMERYLKDRRVEGLLFSYHHFYGSYRYVGNSRRWYRREVRVVRNGIGVRSWGDAQGFRLDGRPLRVKPLIASIYHYGWVKTPEIQQAKQESFNKLWHDDEWVEQHVGTVPAYDYSNGGTLKLFSGTHPTVMSKRVAAEDWNFEYDTDKIQQSLKERILDWIESKTGVRIGEYKNYELV